MASVREIRRGAAQREAPRLKSAARSGTFAVGRNPRNPETGMCRNIKPLFNFEPPASDDEIRAASLQFVRKISGFAKPSQANDAAFERAVDEVARASRRLMASLVTTAQPRDRDIEAEKHRERSRLRFATAG